MVLQEVDRRGQDYGRLSKFLSMNQKGSRRMEEAELDWRQEMEKMPRRGFSGIKNRSASTVYGIYI